MTLRKKGISPIIATILLIVVALILVGILLSWGQGFIINSTSDADKAIDRKCIGAEISFNYCDYNASSDILSMIIVNTGKIDFKEGSALPLILIDGANELYNDETNLLEDDEGFPVGSSKKIDVDLDGQDLVPPFDVEIRSSQCTNFFAKTSCN